MAEPAGPRQDEEQLFRPEVVAQQQSQWLGKVLLAPRLSHTLFAIFAAVSVVGILALLFFGGFTQKARIAGWLVPEQGIVRVFAPRDGRVVRLHVREGTRVEKGTPLALISNEIETRASGETGSEVIRGLSSRRESLAGEQERRRQIYAQQAGELSARLETLEAEQASIARQMDLQRRSIELAERNAERLRTLLERGFATALRSEQADQDVLEQIANLETLQRAHSAAEREQRVVSAELAQAPLRSQDALALLERDSAELGQEVAEAEAQREFVLTAPQDGIVTSIQATAGGAVGTSTPIFTILPAGSRLEAQLFSPSRAIGFVRPGQTVVMRYKAYPYQKFGTYRGTVMGVSATAVNPAELAQVPLNLVNPAGANEPVYRITVRPARPSVIAYGEPLPLQPGMELEADIVLERRRLIEWVLAPLYTLTGR